MRSNNNFKTGLKIATLNVRMGYIYKKENTMNFLYWLLVGAIAGFLADWVIKGIRMGLLGKIIVGMLGGLLGGWLFGLLGIGTSGLIGSIIAAFVGAVILLLILVMIRRK
jgi:uncharacterized membrane protein YeaQ/YmgE (transglycosylase-associated protein family)